ncbi:uncharacterized protein LOC143214938 [Lasioglossum baleicum]|uniref:uncharacterized protein LOC143214938 n=1 Tax=Lasioglossum baleicum TaxID=434251 RepID=UPI003FCDB60C
MRITVSILLALGLAVCAYCEPIQKKEDTDSAFNCVFEDNTLDCLKTRLARDLDHAELQVAGKMSDPPLSAVIEQTGNYVAEVVDTVQNPEKEDPEDQAADQVEGRRKKIGKKKQKQLQKLLGLAMLLKAKLGLLLQLLGAHFQVKIVTLSFISFIANMVRLWLDLKKQHPPKVVYYEHAQHQHHYEHDDHDHDHDHSYWGRSSAPSAQNLAYSAHVPKTK